jgi:hypothetical protein
LIKYIKQNDTSPNVRATLYTVTGDPAVASVVVLTGASVKFIMRQSGVAAAKVDTAATIVDATAGTVQHAWVAADTDTVGDYLGEFEVTDSSSNVITYWDLRTVAEIGDNLRPEPLVISIVDDLA